MGTKGGWVNLYDRRSGEFTRYHFPNVLPGNPTILSMFEDRRGRIWVGTYLYGLGLFDPARNTMTLYPAPFWR